LLLEAGVNVNATNSKGKTALHTTSSLGLINIVKLLLQHGANINIHSNKKMTAFQYACCKVHYEVCVLLISNGATVEENDIDLVSSRVKEWWAIHADKEAKLKSLISCTISQKYRDSYNISRLSAYTLQVDKYKQISFISSLQRC